ncbi:MAG TPA: CocE/NonD family hydrolase [Jatrophihabitantaceae bacterium]|nr:CocE/NonD family hydrolase [Jatrophihabitantaceae bacterium]
MRISTSRRQLLAGIAAAALAVAALVALVVQHSHSPRAGLTGAVSIPASGGAHLAGRVYTPAGSGTFPLVVMPGSWGSPPTEYAAVATGFAALGYQVVVYSQRGFGGSTGAIDFAGTATRDDVSTVIDWARAHTSANDGPVATVGMSYGAGIGLLAAEHDSRIKAVAAISGWADFTHALAPGGTPSEADYQLLFSAALTDWKVSPQLRTLITQLRDKKPAAALATMRAMSPSRSAADGVSALNKNKTAVFLAGAYEDSLVASGTLIDLYDKLTGPKHLVLFPGDHDASVLSVPGSPGTALWLSAAQWVAHYINGGKAISQKPVQLKDAVTGAVHSYAAFPAVKSADPVRLGAATGSPATGSLAASSAVSAWKRSISAAVATGADAGPQQAVTGKAYQFPSTAIANVARTAGAVWSGQPVTPDETIAGVPTVHVGVSSTASSASLFAYLYDVNGSGTGTLISYGTRTLTGKPGATQAADIDLGPIAWTVAAGHHLSLVIDSVDARYLGRSVPGSTITLSSTAADPATLTVPVG